MSNKNKQQISGSKKDIFLWFVIIAFICAAIVANTYFVNVVWSLKLVGWILLAIVVVLLTMMTKIGKRLWQFTKDARMEMRKVVWPTRHETVRTTMIVSALVVATALFLWGVDSLLLLAIGWITGQRG